MTGVGRGIACIGAWVLAVTAVVAGGAHLSASPADVSILRSIGGIPPDIVGAFRGPAGFQQTASGQYMVFDRRGHAVYGIDRDARAAWKIVQIGGETGRILDPTAFDMEPRGSFAVADVAGSRQRIQVFGIGGALMGGFTLPGSPLPRLTLGDVVVSGIGSMRYTGRSILLSQPENGTLITEFSLSGSIVNQVGELRRTGHEAEPDLHLALNSGIPLVAPGGSLFYVFQGGIPMFRKYERSGRLVFERYIQGRELDDLLQSLPTVWPRRETEEGRELPLVMPNVVTAAVDRAGNLWIVLTTGHTYVYNPEGDKIRTVQFQAAGPLLPTSLFFTESGTLLVTPGCYEFRVPR
jgi:hypothetical protein